MNKSKFLILAIFTLLLAFQTTFAQNNPNSNQSKKNLVVQDLDLDRKEVIIWCRYQTEFNQHCFDKSMEVEVVTVSKTARTKKLTYYYSVSNGKIIGDGARVRWDFSGVKPGTYTITIGVGKDGKTQGNTITKTMVVRECMFCEPHCIECPSVSFKQSLEKVNAGDTVTVSADLTGGYQRNISFMWAVSGAEITKGQNTSEILIKIPNDFDGENLTVNLELLNGLCVACPTQFSTTIKISKKPSK